ncbi:transcriptional regulatory protein, partial [Paraphaeosphaeria sporulosa]
IRIRRKSEPIWNHRHLHIRLHPSSPLYPKVQIYEYRPAHETMSTRSAESRDNSPDASAEKRASKKRKVLSCYACRNRKMKCDRVYPVCGRCQKTGRADQCTYDPRLLEDIPVNGDGYAEPPSFAQHDSAPSGAGSSDLVSWKLRVQERRLEQLENKLAAQSGTGSQAYDSTPSHFHDFKANEPLLHEEMMFRGKAFKTQFYGSTCPLSALTQFSELQAFTRESVISSGNMGHVRDDFKAFRVRRKAMMKEKNARRRGYDEEIFLQLPDKTTLDPQVALYFQTCETSYRILHEPSFWREYQAFWERQSNDESFTPFAAVLLYILAVTKCLQPNDGNIFVGDSAVDRDTALDFIETCDTWLQRQSRKQTTLTFFQLHCLSLLAKRLNCLKLKQDWTTSGDIIRVAIAAGLHRNPSLLSRGRISEFEKEMRRRVWLTIVELELQGSIDCGLPSSACGLYFDVQPPFNLPDETFAADTTQIPAGRPIEHFTSTSYLIVSLQSMPLRLHLLQLLNNPTTELQYSDVLHYDSQLNAMLNTLPNWTDPRADIPSTLLKLQLVQFLLILHRPYAVYATTNKRFSFSFTACIEAASTILMLHEKLLAKNILSLNHLRNDALRAGIALAQTTYYNCFHASPAEGRDAPNYKDYVHPIDIGVASRQERPIGGPELKIPQLPTDSLLASTLCTTAVNLLEKVRLLFENKVMRLGTGYMEYFLLCSAQGIMPKTSQDRRTSIASITNATADDLRSRGRKSLERVTSLCFRVLALQKEPADSLVSSLRQNVTVPSPLTPASSLGPSTGPPTAPHMYGSNLGGGGLGGDMPTILPGTVAIATALNDGKGIGDGAFDDLQDMQVDLSGWTFPDFWNFDMGGAL